MECTKENINFNPFNVIKCIFAAVRVMGRMHVAHILYAHQFNIDHRSVIIVSLALSECDTMLYYSGVP